MKSKIFTNQTSLLYHGDALKILAEVRDQSVDLIFADPPYNIGKRFADFVDKWRSDEEYMNWCKEWLTLCIHKLKPDGSMYVMCSTQSLPHFDLFLRKKMTVLSRIVWFYDSSGVQAKNRFGSMYEPILHCVKDESRYTFNTEAIMVEAKTGSTRKLMDYRKPIPTPYNTTKVPGNVWTFPRVRYRMPEYEEHPTQKPEALLERIVLASSNPGNMVLDPFSGSFTTGAVSQRLGRRFIGIEQEKDYVKIGLRRLGIQEELEGTILVPPKKSFTQKKHREMAKTSQLF